jgi:hypothetical protein
MPAEHDYHCPNGHTQRETISVSRFPVGTPVLIACNDCGAKMDYFPEGARTSLMPEDFFVDVGDGPIRLRSISEIRRFERESQQRYANGEGAPYNLRAFSNDNGNMNRNTFGDSPREPFSKTNRQGKPYVRVPGGVIRGEE